MSVREINESIILIDALTGNIITTIERRIYKDQTIKIMINDIINDYIFDNKRGLIIKNGYNN